MTPGEYLQQQLDSQGLTPSQEKDLQSHKKEVTDFLRAEFGADPVIKYAGSREKGTMISDRYDLDIVCYFPSTDERSLKEIREDLAKRLREKYETRPKASAERILDLKGATAPVDFHIDVVPGRFIEDTKDVFLHVAYGDKERMKTNLKTHIDHIVNSGSVPVIRLVKLWAHRNRLQIKTFILELFVIEALSGSRSKSDLKQSFLNVLTAFETQFETMQLVDPANSNNAVSQLMPSGEKTSIAISAGSTLKSLKDFDDIAIWQQAFRETGSTANSATTAGAASVTTAAYGSGGSFTPTRQWGDHDKRI
jgi:hypothetical protein